MGRQLADCSALAAARFPGVPTRVYEDNDISAWSGRRRPAYSSLLEDIAAHRLLAICAYNLDRLFRHPRDLEAFLDLCQSSSFTNVLTAAGDIDLSTHDGQLHARILAAVGKKESDDKSRRVTRAIQSRNESGLYHGGRIPPGFTAPNGILTPDPDTIPAIHHAYRSIIAGQTLHAVHRAFPPLGTPPRTYARPTALRSLLLSPYLIARTRTGDHPCAWPPLVDIDLYMRASAILRDPRRDLTPHAPITLQRWLVGIIRCDTCDIPMSTQVRADQRRRYVCRECWRGIDALLTETYIEALVLHVADLHVDTHSEDFAQHEQDRRVIDAQLNLLADDFGSGLISRDEWFTARQRLLDRRPVPSPALTLPSSLSDAWATMLPDQRRAITAQLLISITVLASPPNTHRFTPNRLVPHWYDEMTTHSSHTAPGTPAAHQNTSRTRPS